MKKILSITCCSLSLIYSYGQANGSSQILWSTKYDGSILTHMETGFSDDSKLYAYGSNSGKVFIRDVATVEIYTAYQEQDKQIISVAFQPKGSLIASGDKNGTLVIYDYISKSLKYKIEAHKGMITSLSFSSNGEKLVTGGNDNSVKVWNVNSGALANEIKNVKGNIRYVKVTNDDKKIVVVTGAGSNGARIYDFTSGTELVSLPVQIAESADLSPNGIYLAVN